MRNMLLSAAVVTTLAAATAAARAQSAPAPAPSPAESAAPNPIGPPLGPNDPCTSLPAIVTRPSVTNSVCTVRPNHYEIEAGYTNATTNGANAVAYPQSLVRIGTAVPALELQIAPPSIVRTSTGGVVTGATDVGAGVKYVFGYGPKLSWGGQAFFTAPTGANGVSANGTNATYALNAAYALGPVFSVATTLASSSLTNGTQRWHAFVPSVVVGATLANATGVYVEIASFSNANGPSTPSRKQYIYGLYRDIGPRLQVDASATVSPPSAAGALHALGFGVSYYL